MKIVRFVSLITTSAMFFICAPIGFSQNLQTEDAKVQLGRAATGSYRLTERSDWSRYDNGKYRGHVYRETRAALTQNAAGEYWGTFFVLEETLRDLRASAQAVDAVYPAVFTVDVDGSFVAIEDNGFPRLRGFPAFPAEAVSKGSKWTAGFIRAVNLFNSDKPLLVPHMAEYEYKGQEVYRERLVYRIFAKYATRYRSASDEKAPAVLVHVQGTHDVDILIDCETGSIALMRDYLDETYIFADKSSVRFKGFTLTFTQGSLAGERKELVAKIKPKVPSPETSPDLQPPESAPEPKPEPFEISGVLVEQTDAGVRLTVRDLRFAPDSAELLPGEGARLEIIAQTLKKAPKNSFLVEGHTASAGKPSGEAELSKRRAKTIVDQLVARGISADKFIYMGWGSSKPMAPNDTEDGRAQNRRVEITILD